MSATVAQCTHLKTNGEVCGSPAVSGTEFCYHHSAVKTALGKPHGKAPFEGFAPIPFIFPEDRASMQINFFLLLQAFNEQRIDQRTYRLMLSMLKAMAKNLGKTGSLVDEANNQGPGAGDQKDRAQGAGHRAQEASDQEARDQEPGTGDQKDAASGKAAGLQISAGSIEHENCFLKKPKVQVSEALFRMNPLERGGHGFNRAAGLLTR